MNHAMEYRVTRKELTWAGMVLLLAIVALGVWVSREITPLRVGFAVAIVVTGLFAMAAVGRRMGPASDWAWWATAGVMSLVLVVGVALAGYQTWGEMKQQVWILPWLLLTFTSTRSRSESCSVVGMRGGLMMVGVGAVITGVVVVAGLI